MRHMVHKCLTSSSSFCSEEFETLTTGSASVLTRPARAFTTWPYLPMICLVKYQHYNASFFRVRPTIPPSLFEARISVFSTAICPNSIERGIWTKLECELTGLEVGSYVFRDVHEHL